MTKWLVYINGKRHDDVKQISVVRENVFNEERWKEFSKLHRSLYGYRPMAMKEKFLVTFEDGRQIEFVPEEYLREGPVWWIETEKIHEIQTA